MFRLSLFYLLLLLSCQTPAPEGPALARHHCGSCHQFPEPVLLDKASWKKNVLPAMAFRMGLIADVKGNTTLQDQYFHLTENMLVPEKPLLTKEEWEQLRDYYLRVAPDSLKLTPATLSETKQFTVKTGPAFTAGLLPAVTFVHYSLAMKKLIYGAYGSQQIYISETDTTDKVLMNAPSMLTHLQELAVTEESEHQILLTFLGQVIRPDAPAAGVVTEARVKKGQLQDFDLLPLPMLHRPTQAEYVELTGDGDQELLVCEFGYMDGKLAYWTKDKHGKFQPTVIRDEPGALQFEAADFNNDGLTDLMVLFAHGDERISIFENLGEGKFSEKVLLRFPPVYGSSSFALADLDGDGLKDIIYTCGDNADLSPVVKPYHGVYLFKNLGNQEYEEVYHQPMPGAYQAVAEDFDQDGDLDVAAVAFFVEEENPDSPAFVYLEQNESLRFEPSTIDVKPLGRWVSIDAGDIDQDGDLDLMLGNAYGLSGLDMIQKVKNNASGPWLLLENQLFSDIANYGAD